MYSMKSRVRYSEADSRQKMTFQALTNYLQDCCIFQSEDLGIGVDYLQEHAQAWFLASWQIVVTAAGSWRKNHSKDLAI